ALKGQGADQDWMAVTDSVGVFSDEFRNELKSGFGCEGEPMFLTGGKRNIQFLFKNIKAQPANIPSTGPGDVVQYIEAHDNMPLFDVIAQSIKKDPDIEENFAEIHRRVRLGNVILMTSQGTAFMHAGQEFGRSKQWRAEGKPQHKYHDLSCADGKPFKYPYFIHDSYDSSDAINRFNWKKATDIDAFPINVTTREYTSGLIKLRRSTDAFRLPDYRMIDSNVNLIVAPEIAEEDLLIAYNCQGTDDVIYHVFVNADSSTRRLTLKTDLTHTEVLVDQKTAGISALAKPEGFSLTPDSIEIEPLTAVIFRSKK
ncbi:MAG: pullulanase, partial [Candidatus Riflebacteria bacterium]